MQESLFAHNNKSAAPGPHVWYACRLVHWCHGATGLVPLLATAQRVLGPKPEWQAAADRAADVVWQRGLLLKVIL